MTVERTNKLDLQILSMRMKNALRLKLFNKGPVVTLAKLG